MNLCPDCQSALGYGLVHRSTAIVCAACGHATGLDEQRHAIDRDGYGIGPEVPLCCECGAYEFPTCAELWMVIAHRRMLANAN
jgi:hypothetical protein